MYETFQCEVCNEEDETQKHILNTKYNILNKEEMENVDYLYIKNESVIEMVKIAKS